MEFTGERFMPDLQGDIRLEHLHRYTWCLPLVAGRRVLDIASGEGYGSRALAGSAAHVTGVDVSPEAVAHASSAYGNTANLAFQVGDAARIPLDDQSVDVVVSFETIEHHDKHVEMMSEIRRVLTPDGLLILSSPNKAIYSDLNGDDNHFHVKELYFDEFDVLVRDYFSQVTYYGQRVTATSLLQPLPGEPASGQLASYAENEHGVREAIPQHIDPMYYVALASNTALPPLPPATAFFSELDNAFHRKDREMVAMREQRDAQSLRAQALDQRVAQLQGDLEEVRARLDYIVDSRSWRLISRLRSLLGRQ